VNSIAIELISPFPVLVSEVQVVLKQLQVEELACIDNYFVLQWVEHFEVVGILKVEQFSKMIDLLFSGVL
jgi:hypothetical protein